MIIEGFASKEIKDRQGDIVKASAFINGIANFQKNSVLLFQHKADKPIGSVKEARIMKGEGLFIRAEISQTAKEIQTLISEGILKAFSIGFSIKDIEFDKGSDAAIITELELFEISIVSIPANPDSLFKVVE